jgi:hypothetical protein
MLQFLSRAFTIKFAYSGRDSKHTEIRKLVLRKGYMESSQHIILKLIGYIYFWKENLLLEPSFRFHRYRPDLVNFQQSEIPSENKMIPKLWVECKQVKIKKLIRLGKMLPYSKIVWISKYYSLNKAIKAIRNKKKIQLPLNVHPIGVKLSIQDESDLSKSFTNKPIKWNIIRKNESNLLISVNSAEIIHLNLVNSFLID